MKKLLRIAKWVVGILLLIPIIVVVLFYIFKKDIEQYGINAINNEITVPFKVGSYDATLWKTFPNFSFTVYNISIEESTPIFNQPLVNAKEVQLVFNIWKVINGKFEVSKLKIDGLTARIGVLKNGNNYDILKSTANDTSSNAFNLKDIKITNSTAIYWDKSMNLKIGLALDKLKSDLSLAKNINEFNTNLKGSCQYYITNNDTLVRNKKISLTTQFAINDDLTFKEVELEIEKSTINGSGTIKSLAKNPVANLNFNTQSLTLTQLLPWISSNSFDQNLYKSTGTIDAKGFIKGPFDKLDGAITFKLINGTLTHRDYQVTLENINTRGTIHFGKKEELDIPAFTASLNDKPLTLTLNLKDYQNPYINLTANGNLALDKVGKLANIEQKLEGSAQVDVSYKGLVSELQSGKNSDKWEGEGTILLTDAGVFNKDASKILSNMNGKFRVKSNLLSIHNLKGVLTNSPFQFSGDIFPIATYLFTKSTDLTIHGELDARHINYEKIIYIMVDKSAKTSKKKDEVFAIPKDVTLNLSVNFDSFSYDKFLGKNLGGKVLMSNGILKLNDIFIQFYEGTLAGNLAIRQEANGNFIPVGYFRCNHVSITKLFHAFDNFSQTEITTDNLSGILNAEITLAGVWSDKLDCDFNRLFAQLDLKILEGRLKNYEPLMALAKFVNVNELMDIQFTEINQSLEIKNNWMYFSPMQLKNNAVNLEILSGKHSLDNVMDYQLKIKLNDLLANKYSLRRQRDETLYTNTSDGGMNLYIHMFGPADNLQFKYDKQATQQVVVQSFKQEKQTVKALLRQEIGLKPKDSTILKPKHIEVEWDE